MVAFYMLANLVLTKKIISFPLASIIYNTL